jgi:hypothetical protein
LNERSIVGPKQIFLQDSGDFCIWQSYNIHENIRNPRLVIEAMQYAGQAFVAHFFDPEFLVNININRGIPFSGISQFFCSICLLA